MKTCPECGAQLSDKQEVCPSCGTDYLEATIASITGDAGTTESDTVLMILNGMEDSLRVLDSVAKPKMGDTLRRIAIPVWGIALSTCILAGVLCKALFFYLLAIIPAILLIKALIKRQNMTQGERVAMATAKVFAEDAARVRAEYAGSDQVIARLDAMQQRVDDTLASLDRVHRSNKRTIVAILVVVLLLFGVGVGALAIRNHNARKAEAEYEALPQWVKSRDSYIMSDQNDEYGDNSLRMNVLSLMLAADEFAAAEGFFFDYCMGRVGDADCALLIVERYRNDGDKDSLNIFIDRLKLRYDSDTAKLRGLKM